MTGPAVRDRGEVAGVGRYGCTKPTTTVAVTGLGCA
jgi:hypothetical protein